MFSTKPYIVSSDVWFKQSDSKLPKCCLPAASQVEDNLDVWINQKQLSSNYLKQFLPRCLCYNFGGENPSLDNGTLKKKIRNECHMPLLHLSWDPLQTNFYCFLNIMSWFFSSFFLHITWIEYYNAQLGTLCCIWELSKYLEVESSHLVKDYKHNLSILNFSFLGYIMYNIC